MPILSQRIGVFSKEALDAGVPMGDIPGTGGIQPTAFTVLVSNVDELDPSSDDYSIHTFPGGKFDDETDSNGDISVLNTWVNVDGPTGNTWALAGEGDFEFENGVFAQLFRAVLASIGATIQFTRAYLDITASSGDPADAGEFPETLTGQPTLTGQEDEEWDEEEEEGSASITFELDDEEDVDGVFFEYSEDGIEWFADGAIEVQPGVTTYSYKTFFFEIPTTYFMRARVYKFPDESGPPSEPFELVISGDLPDVNMTMSGGIDLGGSATITVLTDASGIYTLVPGKRNDTIYDRTVDPISEVEVAIPTPFIKTGFLS